MTASAVKINSTNLQFFVVMIMIYVINQIASHLFNQRWAKIKVSISLIYWSNPTNNLCWHVHTHTHTHTHTQYKALPEPAWRHRSSGCGLGRESQIKQRLKRQQIDADLSLLNNTTPPSTINTCQPCMARFVVLAAEILSFGMVCDMMTCNIYNIDAMWQDNHGQ